MVVTDMMADQAAALWTTLATLKTLRSIVVDLSYDDGPPNAPNFFQSMPLLTQIR
jgi:hypothetical protein